MNYYSHVGALVLMTIFFKYSCIFVCHILTYHFDTEVPKIFLALSITVKYEFQFCLFTYLTQRIKPRHYLAVICHLHT